jgi:hypothetical protein
MFREREKAPLVTQSKVDWSSSLGLIDVTYTHTPISTLGHPGFAVQYSFHLLKSKKGCTRYSKKLPLSLIPTSLPYYTGLSLSKLYCAYLFCHSIRRNSLAYCWSMALPNNLSWTGWWIHFLSSTCPCARQSPWRPSLLYISAGIK